jgi:hypothetical protein
MAKSEKDIKSELESNPLLDAIAAHKPPLVLSKSRRLAIVVHKPNGEGLLIEPKSAVKFDKDAGRDNVNVNIIVKEDDIEIDVFRSGANSNKITDKTKVRVRI